VKRATWLVVTLLAGGTMPSAAAVGAPEALSVHATDAMFGQAAGMLPAAAAAQWQAAGMLQSAAPVRGQALPGDTVGQDTAAARAALAAEPVTLGADTLFWISAPLGPFTPRQRAEAVRERLLAVARDPFARIDTVTILDIEGRSDVMLGERVLTSVTAEDARAANTERAELARERANAIAEALGRTALSRNLRTIALGLLYTVVATLVLVFAVRALRGIFVRVRRKVRQWQSARLGSLRVQNLEVVSAARIGAALGALLTLLRVVVTLLIGYAYLLLVFSFFPWTSGVAARLVQYAIEPVVSVFGAFLDYVPNLFYIVVIVMATSYVLKLIHLIFDGVRTGAITFSGFFPDWADPTYKIVRFIVIALALILVWPHLPSSDRPEFRGVAAFIGLLLSLGAASAVANVIGGIVMVYMRPFQIGDRVKIADTVGDVLEKTLLVTRVRTIKNVDITIPNSMVLGSHIINYSTASTAGGLILHTTVTIGYDVPWRTVHELLTRAALSCDRILREPRPFVLQTALNDFSVAYELNAYTAEPNAMASIYSELHQHIQDEFARAGVEIMSPVYEAHREGPSTVPAPPTA
jgi:small-conductance mechanosensitive channel